MAKNFARILFFFGVLGIMGVALSVFGIYFYFSSFATSTERLKQEITVEIPFGSSVKRVCEILHAQGLIKDPQKFYWFLRLYRRDTSRMQAGYYVFDGQISPNNIAERLQTGRDQAFKLTYKEGESLVDLAQALDNIKLVSPEDFTQAMQNPEILDLIKIPLSEKRLGLKNNTGGLEGYLFPDTYFFSKRDTGVSVIKKMHQRLLDKLNSEIMARMKEQNLHLHEVLTLASIIEKESGTAHERPLIASVYQNRLKQKMRLQADPTVIYGIKDYKGKIRKADLLAYHAYNTYKISGLPPGPIAAPGLESIKAVLWPASSDYLYFVSKNDGTHVFCANIKCHNQAVKKWQIDYFKNSASR
jgi:UPF0755 protein